MNSIFRRSFSLNSSKTQSTPHQNLDIDDVPFSVLRGEKLPINKILSRDSSFGKSSRVYYRSTANVGVPFQWEKKPGTPMNSPLEEVVLQPTPPLPPPATQSIVLARPPLAPPETQSLVLERPPLPPPAAQSIVLARPPLPPRETQSLVLERPPLPPPAAQSIVLARPPLPPARTQSLVLARPNVDMKHLSLSRRFWLWRRRFSKNMRIQMYDRRACHANGNKVSSSEGDLDAELVGWIHGDSKSLSSSSIYIANDQFESFRKGTPFCCTTWRRYKSNNK
ncbi:hypothetical protein QVD17_26240 [Tagetes erecta]|uniref:Uncharacterized protein n=1 Tax=Tagetes erecta TaxID=13708 RepID=A0AAD8K715_TARER|nr:hypothetical protein QVD17_26240 [Tagetes erecta]